MAESKEPAGSQENREKLITETITGRKLTPGRLLRGAVRAALCGVVFGAAAALALNAVKNYTEKREAAMEEAAQRAGTAIEETSAGPAPAGETADEAESAPQTLEDAETHENESGKEPESRDQSDTSGYAGGTGTGNEDPEDEEAGNGDEAVEEAGGGEAGEKEEASEPSYLYAGSAEEAIAAGEGYLVGVSAISNETTWFDSVFPSSTEYSGLILKVGEDEVLILTTAKAAESETLKVTFRNGVSVDAYLKQLSEHDGLAVLAVSAVNGIEENMLSGMQGIEFADEEAIVPGKSVMAAGSPLGVNGSYAFGHISYADNSAAYYDTLDTVFYADITADTSGGTFMLDYEGRLLGLAVESHESGRADKGYSLAVSAASIKDTVESLMEGKKIAFIGIEGAEVTFDMRYNGTPEGIYITDIEQGSPAYNAGIMRGDIITKIDGVQVADMHAYKEALREHGPGDAVSVTVSRIGAEGNYNEAEYKLEAAER